MHVGAQPAPLIQVGDDPSGRRNLCATGMVQLLTPSCGGNPLQENGDEATVPPISPPSPAWRLPHARGGLALAGKRGPRRCGVPVLSLAPHCRCLPDDATTFPTIILRPAQTRAVSPMVTPARG
jgi:hypothetical protein